MGTYPIVIVGSRPDQHWLWDPDGTVRPLRTADLVTLKVETKSIWGTFQINGRTAFSINIDQYRELDPRAAGDGADSLKVTHAFMSHEVFHTMVQAGHTCTTWESPKNERSDSRHVMRWPLSCDAEGPFAPRLLRGEILHQLGVGSKAIDLNDREVALAKAQTAAREYFRRFPQDAIRASNLDQHEGSAEYFGQAVAAVGANPRLCQGDGHEIGKEILNEIADGPIRTFSFQDSGEAYSLGYRLGAMMTNDKVEWQKEVVAGKTPLEVFVARGENGRGSSGLTSISPEVTKACDSTMDAMNRHYGPGVEKMARLWSDPGYVAVSVQHTTVGTYGTQAWLAGAVGGQDLLTNYSGVFGEERVLEVKDLNLLAGRDACGENRVRILIPSADAQKLLANGYLDGQIDKGRFEIRLPKDRSIWVREKSKQLICARSR